MGHRPLGTVTRPSPVYRGTVRDLRLAGLGGGTGLPVVLRGLKNALFPPGIPFDRLRDASRLTGIATVADDGGSSGRLRAEYRLPAPGDIRNCLVALADGDRTTTAMFDFRFDGGEDIRGHSLGNLILTALNELEQDFLKAVERGARMLEIRGQIFPSSVDDVRLTAEFSDGRSVCGESRIASVGRPIRRLRLSPEDASAPGDACEALERADTIVIGPGSLYSSLVAVLLVRDLADAIARSRARVIFVMNLMTEPGETDRHTAVDHLLAVHRHAPEVPVHTVLLNSAPIPEEQLAQYASQGARPVGLDRELLHAMGYRTVEHDLLAEGATIRHDPDKLARAILDLATEPEA